MPTRTSAKTSGTSGSGGTDRLFVDTSGWVCLLDPDQPLHQETVDVYQQTQARGDRFITTNYVITEVVALLTVRTRIPRQRIIAFIDTLKTAPHVEIVHISEARDAEAWALLKARADKEWSLVDTASFVVMTAMGITEALTTDHHFSQAGFVRLPRQN